MNIHWKDWCWSWSSNTLATWCEELIHLKRPWCWERLKAGGECSDTGWDGWMASLTGWAWVWAISRGWWWTGKPALLQSMGSRRVGHDWVTELKLNQSGLLPHCPPCPKAVCRWQAGYEVLMLVVGAAWDMFGPKLPGCIPKTPHSCLISIHCAFKMATPSWSRQQGKLTWFWLLQSLLRNYVDGISLVPSPSWD